MIFKPSQLAWVPSACGECYPCRVRLNVQAQVDEIGAWLHPKIGQLVRERELEWHRWPKRFEAKQLERSIRAWRQLRRDLVDDVIKHFRSEGCANGFVLAEVES